MYLRFSTMQVDSDSRLPQGVFAAAYELLYGGELSRAEWLLLRKNLDWYNEHLRHPPEKFRASRAIFWFRADAKEPITRIWSMVELLREHGRVVEVRRCRHLHNIVYVDDLQVAAYSSEYDARVTVS